MRKDTLAAAVRTVVAAVAVATMAAVAPAARAEQLPPPTNPRSEAEARPAPPRCWLPVRHKASGPMRASGSNPSHNGYPTTGKVRGLVVLVEFDDVQFTVENPTQYYADILTKEGYSGPQCIGSARDYLLQNSNGLFDPQFDICGPVRLPNPTETYGKNDSYGYDLYPAQMVIDACTLLDNDVDFSRYDNDGDGEMDFIFCYYAGTGENTSRKANDIWPHTWTIGDNLGKTFCLDGVKIDLYACTGEKSYNKFDGPSTFIHEFLHTLGLRDLYNTSSGSSSSPKAYSIMDSGNYNTVGTAQMGYCPPAMSAFERYELGWLTPRIVTADALCDGKATVTVGDTLLDLLDSNTALLMPVASPTDDPRDGEYFVLENRQQHGWDASLPNHGMLVWHVEYDEERWLNNQLNTVSSHPLVDLVEANTRSASAYSFPGSTGCTVLNANSKPGLAGWTTPLSGSTQTVSLGLGLSQITETPQDEAPALVTFSLTAQSTSALPTVADERHYGSPRIVCDSNGRLRLVTPIGQFGLDGKPLPASPRGGE